MCLINRHFLTWKDFAVGGQVVDSQKAFQGHVMMTGDGVWAVTAFDIVSIAARGGFRR